MKGEGEWKGHLGRGEENQRRGKPLNESGALFFKTEREEKEKNEENEELVIKAVKIPLNLTVFKCINIPSFEDFFCKGPHNKCFGLCSSYKLMLQLLSSATAV